MVGGLCRIVEHILEPRVEEVWVGDILVIYGTTQIGSEYFGLDRRSLSLLPCRCDSL
jgi:hypothetical protein